MRLHTVSLFSPVSAALLRGMLLVPLVGAVACKARQGSPSSEVRSVDPAAAAHTYQDGNRTIADDVNGRLADAIFKDGTALAPDGGKSKALVTSYIKRAYFPCVWQEMDKDYVRCKVGTLHTDLTFTVNDPSKPAEVDVLVELLYGSFEGEDFAGGLEVGNGLTSFDVEGFHNYSSDGGRPTYQIKAVIPANTKANGPTTVKATVGFHNFWVKRLKNSMMDVRLSIKRNLPDSGYPITPAALSTYVRTMYLSTDGEPVKAAADASGSDEPGQSNNTSPNAAPSGDSTNDSSTFDPAGQ